MSTPSFGQPPAFGASAPPPPPPVEDTTPGGGRRTVVLAVAAGVVALGVLGGAAVLVLGTDDPGIVDGALPPAPVTSATPSQAPSPPRSPLPTAGVLGRNVFVPLVESSAAAGDAVVDPVAAAAESPTPAPTVAPTTAPVAPLPVPTFVPAPAVTRTVEVPGPVVTESVPGPTVTATTPGPVQTVDRFAYAVEVVSVEDPDAAVDGDSTATFVVNGQEIAVLEGEVFLDVFLYEGYEPAVDPATEDTVTFYFGSSVWSVTTGTSYGLGPR